MWFKKLVGFEEESPEQVRNMLVLEGQKLTSKVNHKTYQCGTLEVPSLGELRNRIADLSFNEKYSLSEVVGDVQMMHQYTGNENALFQAASQFNLLEMMGPDVTPENGIEGYEYDKTQGPACAIACGAGTIYRNYFAPVNGQIGQTISNQIDCLADIGKALGNDQSELWKMVNGYALPSLEGLLKINETLAGFSIEERDHLKSKLRIGMQWNTEVTLNETGHLVSQAYCSALPVAYTNIDSIYWEKFARIILEATYEATLHAALLNYQQNGSSKVFLTLVGGSAFGNDIDWILDSMAIALKIVKKAPLDIQVVSYGRSNPSVQNLITRLC